MEGRSGEQKQADRFRSKVLGIGMGGLRGRGSASLMMDYPRALPNAEGRTSLKRSVGHAQEALGR